MFRSVRVQQKNAFAQARPGAKAPPDNMRLYPVMEQSESIRKSSHRNGIGHNAVTSAYLFLVSQADAGSETSWPQRMLQRRLGPDQHCSRPTGQKWNVPPHTPTRMRRSSSALPSYLLGRTLP